MAYVFKANTLKYLRDFVTDHQDVKINLAKEYFVQVIKPGTTLKNNGWSALLCTIFVKRPSLTIHPQVDLQRYMF